MTTALVAATDAGRRAAAELSSRWPDTRSYPVGDIASAWRDCEALVCFLAVGATVRLLAPLFGDKHTDPPVVCVDEARRFAVCILGGHAGGNALADRVAAALDAVPVVTTATDAVGIAALDEIGWPLDGDVAGVTRALLDGEPVALVCDQTWPLPPLPVGSGSAPTSIVVTDRLVDLGPATVALRPPSLVVGVGGSRGVDVDEVLALIDTALAAGSLSRGSVAELATVQAKADERGIVAAARTLGVPLVVHAAEALAQVAVPNPSDVVDATVGTPSVAEAAAMLGGNELLVAKTKSAMATVAVARRRPRGRLSIVGIGPGARDLLTPKAVAALRASSIVVGLSQYVDQVRDLLRPGTRTETSELGDEEARARQAVELAKAGHAVALVGSGDAGVYAMASPALDMADETIDVVGVPGVTAMLAAAAELGAPLGHDHCAISLSDLHTPWQLIEKRIAAAADADFVVAFYNPRSKTRDWQLSKALGILAAHRPGHTPVGIVTDATRPAQQAVLTTLAEVDVEAVGMTTLVIVGSSQSRVVAGRFVTPRGYTWR